MFGWGKTKKKSKCKRPAKVTATLVEVVYRDPSDTAMPTTTPGYGYVYKWGAQGQPSVGKRVLAPVSGRGDLPAVIIRCNAPVPKGYTRSGLSTITRVK